ncbi:MAG: amidohydrolase/deacetylase family metallohydrolase [Gaiellaceae bacterium]
MPEHYDLAVAGGRLLDPARGLDEFGTVAIRGGRIVEAEHGVPARRTLDATGLLVVPGLVDLHTHVYWGVSHYGVDVDAHCLAHGTTTAVDAGSAGARTLPGFRRYVIERAATRVLAYLHVAVEGMISPLVGELEDLRWASPDECVARAKEHADLVVGVKVRLGYQMVGQDPEPALRAAREAADRLELPLMVHVIDLPRPLSWLLPFLDRGDVVTHCFHGEAGGTILDERGRVLQVVLAARERGVLFDVGHGVGSFAFRVGRAALEQDFAPDTISSDIHAYNVRGPVHDLPTTLSKLLHLGMPLADVVRAATAAPAAAVRREPELGSLAPGRVADVALLGLAAGPATLTDAAGESVRAERQLVAHGVVRAGEVVRGP